MLLDDQKTVPQELTKPTAPSEEEEAVDSQIAPDQADVTLAQEAEDSEAPVVGEPEVEEPEVEEPKVEEPKAEEPKVEEPKVDFVTAMRENNLEVFTKEFFTTRVSDKEFANQLIADKHFGETSYKNEIDFNEYEYYPQPIAEHVEELQADVVRALASLSPEERKQLESEKGGDERVYNKYLSIVNDNMGKIALGSAAVGLAVAAPAVGAVATTFAFIKGAGIAFATMYGVAETANSIDRAQRTSPEEIKGLKSTKDNLSAAEQLIPDKWGKFITELLERDEDDSPAERYAKEFGHVAFDWTTFSATFAVAGKGLSVAVKGAKRATSKVAKSVPSQGPREINEVADKLADLILVKQTVKEQNSRLVKAKESFDEIIYKYESAAPPIPKDATTLKRDYNAMAGDHWDQYVKSGYKDDAAYEGFLYNSAKGSEHTKNTKRTFELSKDESEAALAKLPSKEKYGKGAEGTGTTTMDYAAKLDELGAQRSKAIKAGDFELDAKLDTLQSHLMDRIDVSLTQAGGNLQEINRSMPLRRSITEQYRARTQNALELNRTNLTKKHRARLEREQIKLEKRINTLTTNMEGASNTELAMMGVANTIYSNMLAGAAISKAGLGGLVSTATNNVNLLVRGVAPDQLFKMQVNAAKRLKNDLQKISFSQVKSDIVHGTINSRFKSKNVANLKANPSDSALTAGLKTTNKVINTTAAPIHGGLGMVDTMMDRFNAQQRAVEAWFDYSKKQKRLGRTGDELVEELNRFIDNPAEMSEIFNREVLKVAEEGLAADKMMLSKANSKGYFLSDVGWGIDQAFTTTTNNIVIDTALKFVNPFTRVGASMLDSIAENTAIGMFRRSAPNGVLANITPRQVVGTAASYGLFYALQDNIDVIPMTATDNAGSFGLRSGLQIGGHQFPMAVLGVYGEAIEKFMIMQNAIEDASINNEVTSNIAPILGGLLEVSTAYGMGENLKQLAQSIMNIPEGKSKADVTKLVESYLPAGYVLKAAADIDQGSLATNPYLAKVFGAFDTEFGNAKRRDAFGTPLTEGESVGEGRDIPTWLIDRKGADEAGLNVKKEMRDAGLFSSPDFAAFKTEDGLIPYSSIQTNGSYGTFSATMTPLTHAVTIGEGRQVKVTSATRNKALGVMSLDKKTMADILTDEITNLEYMEVSTPESKAIRNQALKNIKSLHAQTQTMLVSLSKYGMNKTLPKVLDMLMKKDAPNITANFDQKKYEVRNLMKYNRTMFGGNEAKQKEFFTRVNRVKDTTLFYNTIKDLGSKFMSNSAEVVAAEIRRIDQMKANK